MRQVILFSMVFFWTTGVLAMSGAGCGDGLCADCHSMNKQEAFGLLGDMVDAVNKVEPSEIPGMWVVEVEKGQQKLPVYVDFSKQFLVTGNVIRLSDRENVTEQRHAGMNKVDISRIPLQDALLLGRSTAKSKVIVFTDPECPYCKKLHLEMKKVVENDPDIAFLIKLFPLKMHPKAYEVSRSIVCSGSMEFLELSFAGKPVPPADCVTSVVDQTLKLVGDLGIRSTPTLVLPDGRVLPGFRTAEALQAIIADTLVSAAK